MADLQLDDDYQEEMEETEGGKKFLAHVSWGRIKLLLIILVAGALYLNFRGSLGSLPTNNSNLMVVPKPSPEGVQILEEILKGAANTGAQDSLKNSQIQEGATEPQAPLLSPPTQPPPQQEQQPSIKAAGAQKQNCGPYGCSEKRGQYPPPGVKVCRHTQYDYIWYHPGERTPMGYVCGRDGRWHK